MPVISASDGVHVRPDHVYVIPPNTTIELHDGVLRFAGREAGLHLPIDILFRSLAKVQGSRAIGVVLSGNASDGSLGGRAIKAECGITSRRMKAPPVSAACRATPWRQEPSTTFWRLPI